MSDLPYWYGSAFNGGGGGSSPSFVIPPQAIPKTKKTLKWKKACLDAFEHIGLRQLRDNTKYADVFRMISGKMSYVELSDAMPQYKEVQKVLEDVEINTELKHFDIIGVIINALAGELSTNSDKMTIFANDPTTSNKFLREKTDFLTKFVIEEFQKELKIKMVADGINPDRPAETFKSPEEQQAYMQQIQQYQAEKTPPQIEKEMKTQWKPMAVKWAEMVKERDTLKHGIDLMDTESMTQFLATGKCFRGMQIGYDSYKPVNWHVLNTFHSHDLENTDVQSGDYCGRIHYYTDDQVISRVGHLMTAKEKDDFLNNGENFFQEDLMFNDGSSNKKKFEAYSHRLQTVPYEGYHDHQLALGIEDTLDIALGERTMMDRNGEQVSYPVKLPRLNDVTGDLGQSVGRAIAQSMRNDITLRRDLSQFTEVFWRSYEKFGYINYYSEDGKLVSESITEDILKEFLVEKNLKNVRTVSLEEFEKKREPNTILWDYAPVIMEGIKVTKNYGAETNNDGTEKSKTWYLGIKPCEVQIKGFGNKFDKLLPVVGIIDNSLAAKIEPFQAAHNLVMNQIVNLLEKEIGLFFIFDVNFLPSEFKEWGDTEETLLYMRDIAKDIGILPVDSSKQNLAGGANFNQFSTQNISFSSQIADRMQLAEMFKNKAFEQIGITPQRLGSPTKYETVEGLRQGQQASYSQTERYFSRFSDFQQKFWKVHLSVAQYCQKDGKDLSIFYTASDATIAYLESIDDDFHLTDLDIMAISNSKSRKELETFKQMLMQNNTMGTDELAMAELISSDTMSGIIEAARGARLQREKQQQQEQEQSQVMLQEQGKQQMALQEAQDKAANERQERLIQKDIEVASINAAGRASDKQSNPQGMEFITKMTDRALKETSLNQEFEFKNRQIEQEDRKIENKNSVELEKINLKLQELATRRLETESDRYIAEINKN